MRWLVTSRLIGIYTVRKRACVGSPAERALAMMSDLVYCAESLRGFAVVKRDTDVYSTLTYVHHQ